jgi:transcriptional regulator with XRE-family HTH domain
MDQAERHLPPEFWSSPAVAAALASCDFATLLEEIRRAHGWTQKQLALAVGYSQSWVSNVLRRQQALTVDQVRGISRRIGVPVHLIRFGDPGGDDPTKRRDFGKAMALALVPLPTRAVVDETTAPTLTAITGAQRRLDATTSARELARGVTAHVEMANRMLARAGKTPHAADVAAAASEAAGFAAWLHADMYDIGSARAYYRMAVGRARQAGHDLLAGYMLGSLAAFELDGGDPELGLTLVGEARQPRRTRHHGHGWTPPRRSVSPQRAETGRPPRTRWPAPRGRLTRTGGQSRHPGRGCSRSTTPSWPGTGHWSRSG